MYHGESRRSKQTTWIILKHFNCLLQKISNRFEANFNGLNGSYSVKHFDIESTQNNTWCSRFTDTADDALVKSV